MSLKKCRRHWSKVPGGAGAVAYQRTPWHSIREHELSGLGLSLDSLWPPDIPFDHAQEEPQGTASPSQGEGASPEPSDVQVRTAGACEHAWLAAGGLLQSACAVV